MSTFEAAVKFFGTYPSWAKIAMLIGLIVTFGVALLALLSHIGSCLGGWRSQQAPEIMNIA